VGAVEVSELGPLLRRRDFLVRSGLVVGASAATGVGGYLAGRELAEDGEPARAQPTPSRDGAMQEEFVLDPEYVQLTSFLLAPHPRLVREAIERHRRELDKNPKVYLFERELELEQGVLEAASAYLGASFEDLALTDSTTMGLGLVYGTLRLRAGEEILTTEHDHYATHESLRLRAERTGATVRRIPLYRDIASVSLDEIVESVRRAIRPRTRAVALTWVHSSTGLKLPIREIADALPERVLLCVDGVHGLGVEDVVVAELGCDIFVAGCHKWLFGPRGTGVVWASREAWAEVAAVIPTFDGRSYVAWIEGREPDELPPAAAMTPGGFHSFEHRWALSAAFDWHGELGRPRVAKHTHDLAAALKDGLSEISGVTVITPRDEELSAGIVCCEVGGDARGAVQALEADHRVVASVTPYAAEYVRFGPSIANTEEDVETALRAVRELV
jgi:selenocysteine lyase/cysteine desulfurase